MKNLQYIAIILLLIFSGCNLIDPLGEELENIDSGITQHIEYTLVDDDFSTITKRALYLNPDDTKNTDFLSSYKYFTNEVQAATYVPMALDNLFPGLGSGSQAKISYYFNGEMPEELMSYTAAPAFNFAGSDYELVSDAVKAAGYFSPLYNPERYVPEVLKVQLDTASEGDMYAINYKYSTVTPEIDYSAYAINPAWQAGMDEDLSEFQSVNVKGDQVWMWAAAGEGSATINGWDNGYFDNEDWLISSEINLSNVSNTHLQISHGVEYFTEGCLFILVSTNYDGENVSDAKWTEIAFPSYEGSDKNNYVLSEEIDISSFDGENIHLAFKYISNASQAPYWGIGEVKVGPYGYKTIGDAPYAVTDYYEFDGKDWIKNDKVITLTDSDYKTLGLSSSNFTASNKAADYLPAMANSKYPFAIDGEQIVILFDHFDGTENVRIADMLTKSEGAWESTYDYIRLVTEPYASTENGWVFDPTVNLTMGKEDYAMIATYVKADPVMSEIDNSTYVDSEYYFGSSAYYQNFDARNGKQYSGFANWQEAVTEAIGTVLLPLKYPDATTQYKGIDMYYVVHFATYGASSSNWYIKFQCTKSAPDPEFTLVEGPIAE